MMNVPHSSHPDWRKLLLREIDPDLTSLPVRIVLSKLRLQVDLNGSEPVLRQCADELRQVFEKSAGNPAIQKDLETIFGMGAKQ